MFFEILKKYNKKGSIFVRITILTFKNIMNYDVRLIFMKKLLIRVIHNLFMKN